MPTIGGGGWGSSRGWGGGSSFGGGQPQVNIQSPNFNWQRNQRNPYNYYEESTDFNPGNPFGLNYRNPTTGAIIEHARPGVNVSDGHAQRNLLSYDRMTGDKNINLAALQGLGGGAFNQYEGGGYEDQDPWEQIMLDPGEMIDVEGVIESYRPRMEEEIAHGFANAGNRMGRSGFAASTPYAEALGAVERSALDDFTNTAMQYKYDAAKFQKDDEMEAGKFNIDKNYNAWAQGGQWGHEAGLMDERNKFAAWQAENDWNQQNNQFMTQMLMNMLV